MTSKVMTFRFPKKLAETIIALAEKTGKGRTAVVVEALTRALDLPPTRADATDNTLQQVAHLAEQVSALSLQLAELRNQRLDSESLQRIEALESAMVSFRNGSHRKAIAATNSADDTLRFNAGDWASNLIVSTGYPADLEELDPTTSEEKHQLLARIEHQSKVLDQILSASPDLFFVHDCFGRYTYVNPAGARALGFDRAEFMGRTVRDLGAAADWIESFANQFDQVLTAGQPTNGELHIPSASGVRNYDYVLSPVHGTDGNVNSVVCIARDITERKRAELSLRESEEKYRNLFESANDSIFIVDAMTHRFLNVNWNAARRLGYTRQELLQKSIWEIDQSASAERNEALVRSLLTGGHHIFETTFLCRDGTELPVEISSWVIEYGDRLAFQSFARDISDRKRAEAEIRALNADLERRVNERTAELQHINQELATEIIERQQAERALSQAEAKYRSIFENAVIGIFQTTPDGRYIRVNPTLARIYGYESREDLIEHLVDIEHQLYVDPGRRAEFVELMQHQETIQDFESQVYRKDDRIIWISEDVRAVRDTQGQLLFYEGTVVDITDRKLSEVALQQRQEQERLMQAIAQRIHRSLDLDEILNTSVTEIRQFLKVDRTLIYRLAPDHSGNVTVESVSHSHLSILGRKITDPCFSQKYIEVYQRGRTSAIDDIYTGNFEACYVNLLASMQVRANLVVPILQNGHLWGLLISHDCHAARSWTEHERKLLKQLAIQLGIAIQQAELYQQANAELNERRIVEASLRESEARYRSLITAMAEGVVLHQSDGQIVACNSSAERILGLTAEQIIGCTPIDPKWQVTREDGSPFPGDEHPAMIALQTGEPQANVVMGIYHSNGNLTWIQANSQPLVNEGETKPYAAVVSFSDITERKRIEAELWEHEALLSAVVSDAPIILYALNQQGQFTLCDGKGLNVLGLKSGDLVGKSIFDLYSGYPDILDINCRVLGGEEGRWTAVMNERTFEAIATPLRDEAGQVTGLISIATDVTERQQAQAAIAKRERYLAELVEVQRRLLAFNVNFQAPYDEILSILGKVSGASRVYVFENELDETGRRLMIQKGVWCGPGAIALDSEDSRFQMLAYQDSFSRWEHLLSRGDIISGLVANFPQPERQVLELEGILSVLILPLIVNGQFFGFIGFDHCVEAHEWEASEIDLLRAAATAIVLWQERASIEADLQASEARYAEAISVGKTGIWDWNLETNEIYLSPDLKAMLGFTDDEMPNQMDAWAQRVHPEDAEKVMIEAQAHLDGQKPFYEIEHRMIHKDGSIRWFLARGVAVRDENGRPYCMMGSDTDITALKVSDSAEG
jgi:PAS domain S-box-containing protein